MTEIITRKEKISYGLGDMASHIGLDNVIIFLTFYYTDVVGLPAAFVGTMFLLARTADAIIDPAMGYIADRTRTRWGKFRPWMLWLALPFGASCLLTYAVPASLDLHGKMIFATVSYTLMMLMYTAINIPYCSMGAVITPDNDARISLQSYRFFLATLGGALSTFFMMPLAEFLGGDDKLLGYRWAMAIMATIAVVMFWICFANTRERIKAPATHNNYLAELRDLLRNDQWRVVAVLVLTNIGFGVIRLGAMMYFVTYYLGSASYFMWMLGAHILGKAAGSALAKRLTQNVSKVQMFGYCSVLAGVLSIALFFAPKSVLILVPMTFIVSTLYQATTTLMWVMMADVRRMETGETHGRRDLLHLPRRTQAGNGDQRRDCWLDAGLKRLCRQRPGTDHHGHVLHHRPLHRRAWRLVTLRVCHAALVQARRQHNAIHPSCQTPYLEGRVIHE